MATLKQVKIFFEKGPSGRRLPLSELKKIGGKGMQELRDLLDMIPEDERT